MVRLRLEGKGDLGELLAPLSEPADSREYRIKVLVGGLGLRVGVVFSAVVPLRVSASKGQGVEFGAGGAECQALRLKARRRWQSQWAAAESTSCASRCCQRLLGAADKLALGVVQQLHALVR